MTGAFAGRRRFLCDPLGERVGRSILHRNRCLLIVRYVGARIANSPNGRESHQFGTVRSQFRTQFLVDRDDVHVAARLEFTGENLFQLVPLWTGSIAWSTSFQIEQHKALCVRSTKQVIQFLKMRHGRLARKRRVRVAGRHVQKNHVVGCLHRVGKRGRSSICLFGGKSKKQCTNASTIHMLIYTSPWQKKRILAAISCTPKIQTQHEVWSGVQG